MHRRQSEKDSHSSCPPPPAPFLQNGRGNAIIDNTSQALFSSSFRPCLLPLPISNASKQHIPTLTSVRGDPLVAVPKRPLPDPQAVVTGSFSSECSSMLKVEQWAVALLSYHTLLEARKCTCSKTIPALLLDLNRDQLNTSWSTTSGVCKRCSIRVYCGIVDSENRVIVAYLTKDDVWQRGWKQLHG